jgi:hypothetical protein
MMLIPSNPFSVIPAKAGIHTCDGLGPIAIFASLDSRLRGNDEPEVTSCAS